MSDFMYSL